jgi:hypothetical protein
MTNESQKSIMKLQLKEKNFEDQKQICQLFESLIQESFRMSNEYEFGYPVEELEEGKKFNNTVLTDKIL